VANHSEPRDVVSALVDLLHERCLSVHQPFGLQYPMDLRNNLLRIYHVLENGLRQRAGQVGYRGGFIDHYLVTVIYPPGLTRAEQVGLGLLVLLVAVIGYRGFTRRHPLGAAWRVSWRQ